MQTPLPQVAYVACAAKQHIQKDGKPSTRQAAQILQETDAAVRQSQCGKARSWLAQEALQYNTEYMEINPKNTSKQCCMCGSINMWRKSSKFRCYNCGVSCHADVNAAFNILFTFYVVQWSKHAQAVYSLQNKAGMVLRGKIHLATLTIPSVVGDVMAGTGCPKDGRQSPTNKERLNVTPLNGGSPPTPVVTQAVG